MSLHLARIDYSGNGMALVSVNGVNVAFLDMSDLARFAREAKESERQATSCPTCGKYVGAAVVCEECERAAIVCTECHGACFGWDTETDEEGYEHCFPFACQACGGTGERQAQ